MLTKICKNKKTQGILAILLIITMTLANVLFLGKNLISYAFETDLESQNENTQSNNVKFDAYFNDNGGKNVHSAIFDAASNNAIINLHLAVKDAGYLKEAYIDFRDEQNSIDTNYDIISDLENTTLIQNVNKELKTIALNFVDYGTDAVIQIPVRTEIPNLMSINKLKQQTNVTLRGIYVDRLGAEIEISKTITLSLGWNLETELNLEQSVEKYIPYTNNEQSGMLLQMQVKAKQNREDFALPVKSNEIKIEVPKIADILPESAIVIADGTLATNGDKIEFTENNWNYDKENGTILINTAMYQEDGKVWSGVGVDTYLITYMYPDTTLEESIITSNIEATMELYSAEGVIENLATSNEEIILNQKKGSLVTYNVKADKSEMSKGRMYANCNSDIKTYDTAYGLTIKANVSNYEEVEKLTFEIPTDSFLKEEKEYSIPNTYSSQITINKAKMLKVLGEDGFVKISDGTGTYIINSETLDSDGNYIINLDENISNIIVETSKPIANEIFKLDVRKIISKDLAYSKAQLQEFDSLKINVYANENIVSDTITLTQTSTNAKLEMSNVDLVSSTENKDVNFKIMLNNSSENSDLYKNAVFEIALPQYIEDIYGMANILYTSGLEIDKIEKVNTENGIVLKIVTTGAESMFSDGVITNGAVITIDATLKIGEVPEDVTEKIVFTYTNENAFVYANEGKEEIDINFIARPKTETLTETPDAVTNPDTTTNPELTADPDAKATLEASTKLMYQEEIIASTGSVKEKQEAKYITTIKNTSTVDANNVKLVTNIQNGKILNTTMKILDADGNVLTTQDHKVNGDNVVTFTANWERIPAGGSGVLEYTVLTSSIEQIENNENVGTIDDRYVKFDENYKVTTISYEEYIEHIKLRNTIEITANNVNEEIENKLENTVDKSILKVEISTEDSTLQYKNNDEMTMNIRVENISENTINNLVVTYVLPVGLEYVAKDGEQQIKYDANTRTITINIDKIDANDIIDRSVDVKVNIPSNTGKIQTLSKIKVSANGIGDYYSNTLEINVAAPVLSIDLTSNVANGSYIKDGQTIEINGVAQNTDGVTSGSLNISVKLPERFKVQEATYMLEDGRTGKLTAGSENRYYFLTSLNVNQSASFKIVGEPEIKQGLDEEEISFIATLNESGKQSISSNTLTYKVEKNTTNPDNPNPDNPNPDTPTVRTYRISGKAWLDENQDGKLDNNEKLLEGINALLIDAKTGVIVTDRTNGTIKEAKTSSNGEYTFSNLLPGSYIVIFEYDSGLYNITEYNKTGVTEDLSSKAIQTNVTRDGVTKLAGATNTITISDSSVANMNIGLVENPKFDLSLNLELSKATIVNSSGTKEYTFNNAKLGKIDIPGKYLDSTTATIEYKITIKNEGAVEGIVKKVVDYIPSDLNFDAGANPGWYKDKDGNIYNNTLTNAVLKPGETKELTLILTKKMTGENTGTITNRAEIYEDYNELGLKDYNSTPGNKAQGENDLDYANLIITVKTGQVAMYITITFISIAIIALGAYEINKKVLKGGVN